jgi:hypothetical protein
MPDRKRVVRCAILVILTVVMSVFLGGSAHGQVVAAGHGGAHLTAGGLASIFGPDYGPNRIWGPGGFVDLNLRGHWGLEGEVRFLRFDQDYSVHEDNYVIGPRYRWRFGHYETYAKLLVGNGQFNFPFSYGHGGYLLMAPGAGLDIHYHRFTVRAFDYEYQRWFHFQNSSLSPQGISCGVAYRIF